LILLTTLYLHWNIDYLNLYTQNGSEEIEKLLKFLGVDLDNNLKNDILKQCGFDIMVKRDKMPPAFKEMFFKSDFIFLRKGKSQI
jgi:hypothetical protein